MSKTIDEKVVSLQFDNSRFEKNVSTTMSTLEKLKQKLNFKGASDGLNEIGTAAKNVNMNGLGSAVETVHARFSALQVMGVTALANITNSAVNTGKRMLSALTIDPIKTGLSEYETKMNAVQVIKANTRGKNDMDDIAKALDDLNAYADNTIYNFAQMTNNIGKFTAQGFDVFAAANAVKGMANLAAASGASAEDMARATYQMSQAMGSSIKLMDWNSLRNANMATQELKNTLIALAKTHGIAIDQMIQEEGTFEYTLQNGWLTGEMFTEAMNIYSGIYSDAELKAKGFTDEQIKNFNDLAATAESAATEVKTITQLWDVLKETAQSGWTQTWELIFGDFDASKEVFTRMQVFFSNILNTMSDARNTFLGGALDPLGTWTKIADKLNKSGLTKLKEAAENIANVSHSLEEFQDITSKVWQGDFGNVDTGRYKLLDQAGYDHRVIQDLVNKGYDYKVTMADVEESHKKFGLVVTESAKSTEKAVVAFDKLSDEQLRAADLTEAEIKLYHELSAEAERTGKSISELIDDMSKVDGRAMIIDSLKNAGKGLLSIFTALKDAWVEIFPPMSSVRLYSIITSFNEFSKTLIPTGDQVEKFQRTFKGLFALIDIVATVAGGAFRIGFEILRSVLNYFGMDVLDLTANVGDFLVKLRDGFKSVTDVSGLINKIMPTIEKVAGGIKEWVESLKGSDNLAKDIILGLATGIKNGAISIGTAIVDLAKSLVDKFKSLLGIHSPSTVFIALGGMIIAGLVLGLQNGEGAVFDHIQSFATNVVNFFKNIDFGSMFAGGSLLASLFIGNKVANAMEAMASPFEGLGDVLSGAGKVLEKAARPIKKILNNTAKVVKSFANVMNAHAFSMNADAIKNIAISIGILVGAVLALVYLAGDDYTKIWSAVGVIVALSAVLGVLAFAMSKISETSATIDKSGVHIEGLKPSLLTLAASVLLLAVVVKIIGGMKTEKAIQGFVGLGLILGAIMGVLSVYGKLVKGKAAQNIDKAGKMLGKLGITMLILVGVAKIISSMEWSELAKAGVGLLGLTIIIGGLVNATKLAGKNVDKAGKMIFKLGVAMLLLVLVGKIVAGMSWSELAKAGVGISALAIIVSGLVKATKLAGPNLAQLGSTMLGLSAAMLILVFVGKIISGMSWSDMLKAGVGITALAIVVTALSKVTSKVGKDAPKMAGTLIGIGVAMGILAVIAKIIATMAWGDMLKAGVGIAALAGIVAGLIAVTKFAGPEIDKVGATILKVSLAIGILAAIATVLGFLPVEHLAKGIIAVGLLGAIVALMIASTKNASNCMANLIVMTVAIGVMTAAVILLSRIEPDKLMPAATALGIVMGMFAVMEAASSLAKSAIGSMIVMTVVVGLLAGVLYLISDLPIEATMGTAVALSTLLLALSASVAIISAFGNTSPMALVAVAAMTIVVGALAGILWLVQDMPVESTMGIAGSLSELLLSMSAALAVLTVIGLGGPAALVGIGSLAALIVGIGGIVAGIGALQQNVVDLEGFIDTAIPILEKLGTAIGSFFGNIVGTFADAATQSLPDIGTRLSEFMTNATPFIEGVKTIDSGMVKNVGILVASIVALTAADLVSGIVSFITGGSSFAELGTDLSAFMTNAMPFITGASMLNEKMLKGVEALADTVLTLTAAKVIDGLTSWITGGSSLTEFGRQLPVLGSYLSTFASNLGTFDDSKIATVSCAAEAIKVMAKAADEIPNEGGWLATLLGDNNIETFASYLPGLATHLNAFASNLGNFSSDQISAISCASEAMVKMANAASEIPNEGGWLSKLLGDNSIETFGNYLPGLATNLSSFAANLGTFTSDQVSTISCASEAMLKMAQVANELPNEGGWLAKLLGDNSISTFGGYLPDLGTNLSSFAANLGTFTSAQVKTIECAANAVAVMAKTSGEIDGQAEWTKKLFGDNSIAKFGSEMASLGGYLSSFVSNLGTFSNTQVETVKHAINAVNAFSDLANSDLSGAKKYFGDFGANMVTLGANIKEFVSSLPSKAGITGAISDVRSLISLITDVSAVDANSTSNFKTSLANLGKDAVKGFVDSLSNATSVADVKAAAVELLTAAANAVKETTNKDKIKSAFAEAATASVKGVREKYNSFYNAGSYLVDGFKAGIDENTYKAEAKARAMARAAAVAAQEELDIHSPSRVFQKIGSYIPQGFAIGIEKMSGVVANSAITMADKSIDTVRASISKLSEVVETDIDSQPTIRPVLDLSDVRSGAGTIGDIIGSDFAVGAVAKVGVINSSMGQRIQNGDNRDVVSAINKLRSDMANVDRASYNINGISYDDGSEVSDAIKTLVRHAKIERRT